MPGTGPSSAVRSNTTTIPACTSCTPTWTGNVGYHTLVHRPLTARSPRRALEGWTGRDEVQGRIPFDELPHMLNPEAGYISHANNLPVGSWYPYDLGLATGGTGDTSRSLRLRQLLDGDRKFSLDDFERVLHRDDVNPIVAALLPVARKVVEEDKVTDRRGAGFAGGRQRLGPARRHDRSVSRGGRLAQHAHALSRLGPAEHLRCGRRRHLASGPRGRCSIRAGRLDADESPGARVPGQLAAGLRDGRRTRCGRQRHGRLARQRERPAARSASRIITIPYQRTIPHNLPVVDASLDIVSPPLTCLDQGTIWSQPGNLYTQIVDLSDVDNSRSMIAPGNAEDAAGAFRTNQIDIWVQGTTHAAPLSRDKIEALDGDADDAETSRLRRSDCLRPSAR